MNEEAQYVGIDVSKSQFDLAVFPGGQRWSLASSDEGIAETLAHIADIHPALVVLELAITHKCLSPRKIPSL